MHWLKEFMIFWNLFCASSHYVWVSCSCCSVFVRFAIARLCSSTKVVWSFWRLVRSMGYMIRGLLVGGYDVLLMIMLVGASCSWTG